MATLNLYLDVRHLKKDGTASLKIIISNHGTQAHIPTGITLPPHCWKKGKVVSGAGLKEPATFLNSKISSLLSKVGSIVNEEVPYKSRKSATEIKRLIIAHLNGENPAEEKEMTFDGAIDLYIGSVEKRSSNHTMVNAKKFLQRNLPDISAKPIGEIEPEDVQAIKNKLLSLLAQNTAKLYLSILKASWVKARRRGVFTSGYDPFDGIRISKANTKSRALTIEETRRIWFAEPDESLPPKTKSLFLEGRDVFRLVIGLAGINIIDLFNLTRDNLQGGRIQCDRHKTGVLISIKVEPEVRELIKKYECAGKLFGGLLRKTIMMPHLSEEELEFPQKRVTSNINEHLKLLDPRLTTYWMRHTWASLCAELDIPDRTISMGLAHAYGNAMDSVYITNRYKKLDAANRKVLDWIQQKGEFASKE